MFTSLIALLDVFSWNVHLILNPSEQIKISQPASVASISKPSKLFLAFSSKPFEPFPAFISSQKKKQSISII
jgi:hypothetical protein